MDARAVVFRLIVFEGGGQAVDIKGSSARPQNRGTDNWVSTNGIKTSKTGPWTKEGHDCIFVLNHGRVGWIMKTEWAVPPVLRKPVQKEKRKGFSARGNYGCRNCGARLWNWYGSFECLGRDPNYCPNVDEDSDEEPDTPMPTKCTPEVVIKRFHRKHEKNKHTEAQKMLTSVVNVWKSDPVATQKLLETAKELEHQKELGSKNKNPQTRKRHSDVSHRSASKSSRGSFSRSSSHSISKSSRSRSSSYSRSNSSRSSHSDSRSSSDKSGSYSDSHSDSEEDSRSSSNSSSKSKSSHSNSKSNSDRNATHRKPSRRS